MMRTVRKEAGGHRHPQKTLDRAAALPDHWSGAWQRYRTGKGGGFTGADALQQPAGRVGRPEDIAELILFLCPDKAGFITGGNICADGGMTRLMICHGEHGWTFSP